MKRVFDAAVSALLLVLTAPVQLLVALLIRLDSPGPAYFRQARIGYLGRPFEMLKFRTMQSGTEEAFHRDHLERLKEALGEADAAILRIDDDPRITRVGRWLRKGSLDELPNLWNVVKGDMSLVGPRPLVPDEVKLLTGVDHGRHAVKPGITGLAQIAGRDTIPPDERSRLDLEYVRDASFPYDLKILALTVPSMFRTPGR